MNALADPVVPFLERLVAAKSEVGRQLTTALDLPLRGYLRSLIPGDGAPPRDRAAHAHLAVAVAAYLTAHGEHDVDAVCDHLSRTPVIQQADHSNLLLDPETLLNNLLFHVACRETATPLALTSQCSTVTCLWKRQPISGPVFLRTRGSLLSVFGLSRRQAKFATFCCLPGPLTMTFDVIQGLPPDLAADPILGALVDRSVPDAPTGFRAANREIWARLPIAGDVRRVAVDESVASECVARHLADAGSPVRTLVFDPPVRDTFLEVKRELVRSPANLVVRHASPDFFWSRRDRHLAKVIIAGAGAGARLLHASDRSAVPVPYEPRALIAALRSGAICVDKLLAYTVRCLLPGVVAIGGTAQQDYVRLYADILLETHRRTPFLTADAVAAIGDRGISRLGGMPLLELDGPGSDLLDRVSDETPLEAFLADHLDRPLRRTIGTLACARYYEAALERHGSVT